MDYILLARGGSLESARVLAVSADRRLVERFIRELAAGAYEVDQHDGPIGPTPLKLVKGNSGD